MENINDLEIITIIETVFNEYERLKKKGTLYNNYDVLPQSIIKLYYSTIEPAPFQYIMKNFKIKYIYNENKFESIQAGTEVDGLCAVYDYIQDDGWKNFSNIYIINKLHELLYSKVPNPSFGGSYRNANSYVVDGGKNIAGDYSNVSRDIAALYDEYQNIINFASEIRETKNISKLLDYIDKCVDFKCKLIRIHPFPDGNGRTTRALLNIFFRMVNLPPTYVTLNEKRDYLDAMEKAIDKDKPNSSDIHKFYYYKICDSIFELDIKPRGFKDIIDQKKARV